MREFANNRTKKPVKLTESIGQVTEGYVGKLQTLLSTYKIHHQNAHNLHWNLKGKHFFTLHEKYGEVYQSALDGADLVAEKLRALGQTPLVKYSTYLENSLVEELEVISEDEAGVQYLIEANQKLMTLQQEIFEEANAINDGSTSTMMADLNAELEKANWMLSSWLS